MPNDQMNGTEQNLTLSKNQLKSIPLILGSATITEGCSKAKVSKTTFYSWLKEAAFKSEFIRQRNELVSLALDELKACTGEAVKVLRALLKSKEEGIRLRTATAILDHIGKFIEYEELEQRISEIERRIGNE